MNDIIILVKRDKLMPYGDLRIERTNAGLANHHLTKRPSYI